MKNFEINELNEKSKNELKNDSQNKMKDTSWFSSLIKKFHKWNFELDKKIYKLKNKQKSNDSDCMFYILVVLFGIFGGIVLVYVCERDNINCSRIIARALGFDL
jgi:hypothetical protein